MTEKTLLTKIQNMIDIYNGHIEELENNPFYGSISDERERDCLENVVLDLKDLIKDEIHAQTKA